VVVAVAAGIYLVMPASGGERAGQRLRAAAETGSTPDPVASFSGVPVPSLSVSAPAAASPSADAPSVSPSASASSVPAATQPFKGVANSECADLERLTTSWFYNWGTSPSGCTGHGFVPMVSGRTQKTAAAVSDVIDQLGKAGYDSVLGFNEPNKSDQANLTVAQAVSLWPALTSDEDIAVGSPVTSADTAGQQWFADFMTQAEAEKLRVDFIAVHWYGWNAGSCDADAAEFEKYLNWVQSKSGGRPLWITEFGCLNSSNPDEATVKAFYSGAVKMFARHSQVARYAWYPWIANNHLVADDGTLTTLGTTFAQQSSTR
jgi:hypothetical protein